MTSVSEAGKLNIDVRDLIRPKPGSKVEELDIVWMDLTEFGYYPISLAISALPGCKFKDVVRDLESDIGQIKELGIKHVFILCEDEEMMISSTPQLREVYNSAGLNVHNYPIQKGMPPRMDIFLEIADNVKNFLNRREKVLIHCWGCNGRSCLVMACLLLHWNLDYTPFQAMDYMQLLCGPKAIQTIKQYNFLTEFRELYQAHQESKYSLADEESRRASR